MIIDVAGAPAAGCMARKSCRSETVVSAALLAEARLENAWSIGTCVLGGPALGFSNERYASPATTMVLTRFL
jgi:hypothetical protein